MEIDQRHQITRKVTLVGAATNALLSLVQIIFGFIGQSQALLADGIHTLSDLSSDFVVLYASSHAARAADEEHPYGHGRIETLASLLLGIILIGVGISMGIRGTLSVLSSDQANPELITVFFATLAIASKEFLYRYTIHAARKIHSTLLESNALHHRSDVLSSIVVVIGISSQLAGIPHMDAIAAVIVSVMIIVMGYRLAHKSLAELIDSSLDRDLVADIQKTITENKNVNAIHRIRSRSMGGLGYVDAELRVDPRLTVSEAHFIAFSLEEQIKSKFSSIIDVSIHVDPLTESGHDHVSDLPNRAKLLDMLNDKCLSNPCHNKIIQVNLHYLNDKIDVDIVLPLSLYTTENTNNIRQLKQIAENIDCVGLVGIYFRS